MMCGRGSHQVGAPAKMFSATYVATEADSAPLEAACIITVPTGTKQVKLALASSKRASRPSQLRLVTCEGHWSDGIRMLAGACGAGAGCVMIVSKAVPH